MVEAAEEVRFLQFDDVAGLLDNAPERAVPLRTGQAVRAGTAPAVVGRIENGRLLLDLRAVQDADDEPLTAAVIAAATAAAR